MYKLKSPAKLNLFLRVLSKRKDGFHNIQTYFQIIDLYDYISINFREDNLIMYSDNVEEDISENNLCLKAINSLKDYTGFDTGIELYLEKNIPIGGGLGGGSSNAATILIGLNKLLDLNLNLEELKEIGGSIGADVPVFISGSSSFAEGKGEILKPANLGKKYFLVINPRIRVNTKECFSKLRSGDFLEKIDYDNLKEHIGINVFEKILCEEYAEINEAINLLREYSNAAITGTGGCIFSVFETKKEAIKIADLLPDNYDKYIVSGLEKFSCL